MRCGSTAGSTRRERSYVRTSHARGRAGKHAQHASHVAVEMGSPGPRPPCPACLTEPPVLYWCRARAGSGGGLCFGRLEALVDIADDPARRSFKLPTAPAPALPGPCPCPALLPRLQPSILFLGLARALIPAGRLESLDGQSGQRRCHGSAGGTPVPPRHRPLSTSRCPIPHCTCQRRHWMVLLSAGAARCRPDLAPGGAGQRRHQALPPSTSARSELAPAAPAGASSGQRCRWAPAGADQHQGRPRRAQH